MPETATEHLAHLHFLLVELRRQAAQFDAKVNAAQTELAVLEAADRDARDGTEPLPPVPDFGGSP
jgi:hypothetical protein